MFRLMAMNALLICLILIWTSSASVQPKELRQDPQAEDPTGPKDDSHKVSKKSKAYSFIPSISAEDDAMTIINFNIIKPHPGNDNAMTRKENHTYSIASRADQKGGQLLFFSAARLSWVDAQKDCKARGGALAVLGDEPEDVFDYISENIGRKVFWLGGSDIETEDTWLWLNGNPIDRTKYWRRGQPNGKANENCMYLYRDYYYDRACNRAYQYICDLESEANIPFHERTQYLSFSDERLSWEDAKAGCEVKQGTLAILENEPDDVVAHLDNHYAGIAFWLGGSDIAKEGDWLWLNGNPIDLTKYWRRGEPNNWWGGEDCLEYYRGYNDRSCSRRTRYICELAAPTTAAPTTAAPTTAAPTTVAPTTAAPTTAAPTTAAPTTAAPTTAAPTTAAPNTEAPTTAAPTTAAPTTAAPTTAAPTTAAPTTAAPNTEAPTTAAPTTAAPTTAAPTTAAPTTEAPTGISCNLVWKYEENRPIIMLWGTQTIIPPIINESISNDPNRIPEGIDLIFACPGEKNQFKHVTGSRTHTKLHGKCISHDLLQVCVDDYGEEMDLSNLSCTRKISPSIKQANDTIYKKPCEDIGGVLYKIGYIYGDKEEFIDLEAKVCFREDDQTTLWTSTNVNRIEISPSMQYKDPSNFRTARGFAMNTFQLQNTRQNILKEVLEDEVTSIWNDKACRNHGGYCVKGGEPCPEHLQYQTSQGKPFCSSFYRCCYSEPCEPTTCTYKGQRGNCSLDSLPHTIGVGSQECNKGCQCYIKDNKTLHQFKSLQERKEFSDLSRVKKKCDETSDECTSRQNPPGFWKFSDSQSCADLGAVPLQIFGPKGQCCQPLNDCATNLDPPGLWIPTDILGDLKCSDFGSVETITSETGGQCCRPKDSTCKLRAVQSPKMFNSIKDSLYTIYERYCWRGQECQMNWANTMQGYRPLILKEEKDWWLRKTYHIVLQVKADAASLDSAEVPHWSRLTFSCPGTGNGFKNTATLGTQQNLRADCINGFLYVTVTNQYIKKTIGDMGCQKEIEPTTTIKNLNERCGNANIGNLYSIAFETFPNEFYRHIDVCFRNDQQTTLWTKNKIFGKSMFAQDPNPKPRWELTTPGTPFTINIDHYYHETQRVQETLFSSTNLGIFLNIVRTTYVFSRGHLAPRTDFVSKAEQIATYVFPNALPQWQKYNGANWELIEKKIQKLAKDKKALLEIITGGAGIMHTPSPNTPYPSGIEIFLNHPDPVPHVPIPNLFWKVVIATHGSTKKAVAFVGNNNPNVISPASPCGAGVCSQLSSWLQPSEIVELNEVVKGLTFCCKVSDLTSADFLNIPNKKTIDSFPILNNLN